MSILGQISDLLDGGDARRDVPRDADQQRGLVGMASGLLGTMGGMSGLLGTLRANGLGDQVQSWIGDGANVSISADQLRGALGEERIRTLAAKFGVNPETAATQMAGLLPGLVDKLSSDGKVREDNDVVQQVTGLLSGFLK